MSILVFFTRIERGLQIAANIVTIAVGAHSVLNNSGNNSTNAQPQPNTQSQPNTQPQPSTQPNTQPTTNSNTPNNNTPNTQAQSSNTNA